MQILPTGGVYIDLHFASPAPGGLCSWISSDRYPTRRLPKIGRIPTTSKAKVAGSGTNAT